MSFEVTHEGASRYLKHLNAIFYVNIIVFFNKHINITSIKNKIN